jgi:serine/threonine protein phosphatase PrpC
MPFAFHYAARSDVGMVRSNNEDSGYAGPRLLAMADGMGGHAGGDVASSTVIASLVELDDDAVSGREVRHGHDPHRAAPLARQGRPRAHRRQPRLPRP